MMRRLPLFAMIAVGAGWLVPSAILFDKGENETPPQPRRVLLAQAEPPAVTLDPSTPPPVTPSTLTPPAPAPAPEAPAGAGPVTSVTAPSLSELIPDSWGFGPATSQPAPDLPAKRPLPTNKIDQPLSEARAKSVGCKDCHTKSDAHTMHASKAVVLGCTDCHGGDSKQGLTKEQAHVTARFPEFWYKGANPRNS